MPSPVDKHFKQIKEDNPSYTDEQAWATAWSVFCKFKSPGSPHCHKPTEEYLKKEARLVTDFADALLVQKVASRYMVAMSLPEDVETMLMRWRHDRDQVLDAIVDGAQGVDDLLRDFKVIEREVPHDRDLRQVIRPDVHDVDSLMKLVENLGELNMTNPLREFEDSIIISRVASRVAGYSYKPDSEKFMLWGKGPFNKDVIETINRTVVPFKDDDGKSHDDGFLKVQDHQSGHSVNRLKEDEGYTQEVLVTISFPSGSELKVLSALQGAVRKHNMQAEKAKPGQKPDMRLSERPKKRRFQV